MKKGNRKLASWYLETNKVIDYQNDKTKAEKLIVKKFFLLPKKAEEMYQNFKEQEKIRKEHELERNTEIEAKFLKELYDYCSNYKAEEFTNDVIAIIVDTFASRFLDTWYVVGIHPDRYEDNYFMYFQAAKSRVHSALLSIIEPGKSLNSDRLAEKQDLSDQELIKSIEIIPIQAQREGNLVAITELDQRRFERLVEKALTYAKTLVEADLRYYLDFPELTINWYEINGKFFLPELPKKVEPPKTLRETVLKMIERKIQPKRKPSRVKVKVQIVPKEGNISIRPYQPQKGIITWKVT